MTTVNDSNGAPLLVGDTVCTPGQDSFDFAYEMILADKVGVVKTVHGEDDCVIVELDFGNGPCLSRFRGFELTRM